MNQQITIGERMLVEVCPQSVTLTRTGLAIAGDASAEDLVRLEELLDHVGGSALWWWGDYLGHLIEKRGAEYAAAKAASSYSPETLKKAAFVSRHVPASSRFEALSWAHHSEVAGESPTNQEIWLTKAEDNAWSVKQLRAELRASKATITNGKDQAPADPRAAAAERGYQEFATWYQKERETMPPAQREAWHDTLRDLVMLWLEDADTSERAALLA